MAYLIPVFFYVFHLYIWAHTTYKICYSIWLLFKATSWSCGLMAASCAQLCLETILCFQTIFMGMKWDFFLPPLLDSGMDNVQPLGVQLWSPSHLYPSPPPPHTDTLSLWRPHFPRFIALHSTLLIIDLLFTWEL